MSSFFRKKKPIIIRSQHHHQLFYHEQKKKGSIYECSGCQQPGFGPYYSCNDGCNLYYHPCCGKLLSSDSSSAASVGNYPPYPTGDLVLKETPPHFARCCVACGDRVRMLRYKWRHKKEHGWRNPYWRLYRLLVNRAFHPLCASLPAQIEGIREHGIVLQLMERIRGECLICKGKSKGWAYNSTCGVYGYHVGCVKKEVIQSRKQVEAPGYGGKRRKVTIYLKKVTLKIAKWALQQIIQVLFGLPAATVLDIIVKFFDFIGVSL